MRKISLAALIATLVGLVALLGFELATRPPANIARAAPPTIRPGADANPSGEFTGLELWSQRWSSICLLSGFWAPANDGNGVVRLKAEGPGTAIRIASRSSLREFSYRMPLGSEVVIAQGWVIINGSGVPALVPSEPSHLDELGPNACRTSETLEWKNAVHLEHIVLDPAADWIWTEHDHSTEAGFELWNASTEPGQLLGKLVTPRSVTTDLTASGEGMRLHVCETGGEPWLEVNVLNGP